MFSSITLQQTIEGENNSEKKGMNGGEGVGGGGKRSAVHNTVHGGISKRG